MADGRFYNFDNDPRAYVSVTTFLGIRPKPFLVPWAAKMERELIRKLAEQGHDLAYILDFIRLPDKKKNDKGEPYSYELSNEVASEFGNKIHKAIDYTLKGLKLPRLTKAERKVYDKWLEWWNAQKFELVCAEKIIKSEHYGYAGTLDAEVFTSGASWLILDWKTGKNHYEEHDLQNLAYQHALPRVGESTDGGLLVYIPKEKEIWTEPVPKVDEDNFKPVLDTLAFWRSINNKPWKEN